jgi:hypothetical protein
MTQRNILKHFQQFDVYMVARYQRGCFIHIVNINKRLQSPWDVCARRHGGDWVSVHQTTSEHEARKILARMKQLPDSVGTGNGWWLEVKAISPASKRDRMFITQCQATRNVVFTMLEEHGWDFNV